MTKRILHVVTNIAKYQGIDRPTGLWLSELTHAYDEFEKMGYLQDIVSPEGGLSPLEPLSLNFITADKSVRKRQNDPQFMALLNQTKSPDQINWKDYDVIYYTGGHGVMWDFVDSPALQEITKNMFENGKIVSSVCHGYCALLNVKLSNGKYLIKKRKLTGFSWREEVVAGVSKKVPYNAQRLAKQHGAKYKKALIPFKSYVVKDKNLITGQNPASAKATAKAIIKALKKIR